MGPTESSTSWASQLFEGIVARGKRGPAKPAGAPAMLSDLLEDAEGLLIYATESGIEIEPDVTGRIVGTRHPGKVGADPEFGTDLIAAVAALTAKTWPVTVQTLRSRRDCARQESRYGLFAVLLIVVILPLSWVSFDANQLSTSIDREIATANALTLVLHTQFDAPTSQTKAPLSTLAPPPGSLGELQEFASTIRMIKDHALLLRGFWRLDLVDRSLLPSDKPASSSNEPSPYEIDPSKPISLAFMQSETRKKTALYQKVRSYGKGLQDRAALIYGGLGAYLLPMLYAALGVCAALLRTFQSERVAGSFSNSYDILARFFVAIVAGSVVGQFSGFAVASTSLSPLALAFVVGFSADIFFKFLENLTSGFKGSAPATVRARDGSTKLDGSVNGSNATESVQAPRLPA